MYPLNIHPPTKPRKKRRKRMKERKSKGKKGKKASMEKKDKGKEKQQDNNIEGDILRKMTSSEVVSPLSRQ